MAETVQIVINNVQMDVPVISRIQMLMLQQDEQKNALKHTDRMPYARTDAGGGLTLTVPFGKAGCSTFRIYRDGAILHKSWELGILKTTHYALSEEAELAAIPF